MRCPNGLTGRKEKNTMTPIDKAIKDKESLARLYNVPVSAIVWIGDNKYIVVKNGKEIR